MWSIRFLNGQQAGKIYPLKPGRNVLGRSPQCDVQVMTMGASKEHCEIIVQNDRVVINDLKSRNGTVVNGVRIQSGFLKRGDKAVVHDVIFEIVPTETRMPAANHFHGAAAPQLPQAAPAAQYDWSQAPAASAGNPSASPQAFLAKAQDYIEKVALPGVYRLPTMAEFRWIIAAFLGALIVIVTLLSMMPATEATRASLMKEGQRRAQTLARSLALLNQSALLQGSFAAITTHSIESEDGVKQAYIIQQVDGVVVAPATLQGRQVDLPFVHRARLENKAQVAEIDRDTIGASFPIGVFDPSTGDTSVKYHAVVLYNAASMALDEGRVISLFMQSLLLSFIVGGIVFFFLIKLIEHPIVQLNAQLDAALREKKDGLQSDYIFPALESLTSNINSLLTRYMHGGDAGPQAPASHAEEVSKVVSLMNEACILIRSDGEMLNANAAFSELSHVGLEQIKGRSIQSFSDPALKQNLEFLMNQARENPYIVHSDQLEFNGVLYTLNCQAFGQPLDYFIFIIQPQAGGFE